MYTAAAEDEGSGAAGVDNFEWLVSLCPFRVCPIKAQWSSVSGVIAPGKAGAAWGAAIGAGIGAVGTFGIGTGLGAAIGAGIGGYYGMDKRDGDLDAVYYKVSFRGRMVFRSFADFKQLEALCRKQKMPALPQPPSAAESTLNATSLMEGQCLLARKLDDWLAALAQGLLDGKEPNSGSAPVFLAFLGVLFTDKAADDAAEMLEDSSSEDDSDSEDELQPTASSAGADDGYVQKQSAFACVAICVSLTACL